MYSRALYAVAMDRLTADSSISGPKLRTESHQADYLTQHPCEFYENRF